MRGRNGLDPVVGTTGWLRRQPWAAAHDRLTAGFIAVVDRQLTLGLLLYAVSPITRAFLGDPPSARPS